MPVQELVSSDAYTLAPAYPQLLSALSGWFRSRGVPAEESKDLAQETILRTLIHLKRHGQRGDDLKPLVFTIARNLLTERARRGVGNVVTLSDDIDVADPSPTPLDTVMAGEERTAVGAALASLGSRHRRVIELWMRGDTPADIARTLGIKRNAADALLHRARRRLASVLRESGQAFGGFLGLWALRFRRAAVMISQNDPGALLAQAAGAVAAVTMAGVIATSAPAALTAAQAAKPSISSVGTSVAAAATADLSGVTHPATSKTAIRSSAPSGVYADVGSQSAGVVVKSPGGSAPIGIRTWHVGGEGGQSGAVPRALCVVNCLLGGGR
jgi:RNA polymerase sigma-70 factor (ECF subfamily)